VEKKFPVVRRPLPLKFCELIMNQMSDGPGIFVSLGSNQGDSRFILEQAIEALRSLAEGPMAVSSLWRTAPVDCPPGSPDFLNAVAGFESVKARDPHGLLEILQRMERQWGRQPKKVQNEPRPLDLDLLAWEDRVIETPLLVLPHPRAHLRRFVLGPWAEIAPDFRWPGSFQTVRQLLEEAEG
jgi:2-amino-4-hydroxy-6-hydroxymethyldihydropteridine diphosphokinase